MLRPLRGKPRPPRLAVYDLEWYPDTLELRLIGFNDGERYYAFFRVDEFFAHVLQPRYSGWHIYAHYGGRFDLVFFLYELCRSELYTVSLYMGGASAARAVIEGSGCHWTLCDSQFLFKTSLRKLGESIGMQKGDCAFDAPIAELIEYNKQDCLILLTALKRASDMCAKLGGELRHTLASTALALFRREFLKADIETIPSINDRIRPAYQSSRVEKILDRSEAGYYSDINSSFPYSMASGPLPGNLIRTDRSLEGELTIADVEVKVPECYLPPLPVRHNQRVYFPYGAMRGWYSGPDISLLERSGGQVVRVHEAHHFEPQTYIADYVNTIYPLRVAEVDAFWKYFYKILLNALYGKFGEHTIKERVVFNPISTSCPHDGEHLIDGVSQCVRMLAPGLFAITDHRELPHAHLPISIIVTARSRALLWDYGSSASKLAYWDCDGIFSNTRYPDSAALGGMKLECAYTDGLFVAPKAYSIRVDRDHLKSMLGLRDGGEAALDDIVRRRDDYVTHVKGFPKLSRDVFEGVLAGQGVEYEQFRAIKTASRKGLGVDVVSKYMSTACGVCGAYVRGSCPDHGKSSLAFKPLLRPKRAPDGDGGSRPWTIKEILSD